MSMTKNELAKQIYKTSIINGEFILRSGAIATEYFDKYLFESNPSLLSEVAKYLSELLPENIDALAGLEMGGIPVATAISLKTGIKTLFVRKKAKAYGTCKLAEGGDIKGKTIVIIEDVVTSGGAVINAVYELKKLGANIDRVICVIDREDKGRENIEQLGIAFYPLFTKSYIEKQGKA